ncbi:hypothetical protein ACK32R_20950 [Aeromonas dhakensis]|jgi:hypothetical protein|uniref:hypothetical protein n=1 Tax=Aeromonas dhakensis TaxID=196024 RepID=UPI0039885A12
MSINFQESHTLIMEAQKTIEQIAAGVGEGSPLPEQMQQQMTSVIIETQGIIGMLVAASENSLPTSEATSLLKEYHEKNRDLLGTLVELGVVKSAA